MIEIIDKNNYIDLEIEDLIVVANARKDKKNTDTVVSKVIDSTTLIIKGEYKNDIGDYCVVGDEIIKVINYTYSESDKNTTISYQGKQCHTATTKLNLEGKHFRSVIILKNVLSFNYEDSIGAVTNNIFPVEVSTGKIIISDLISNWSPLSDTQIYSLKPKNSVVYIFKGFKGTRYLKNTVLLDKVKYNSKTKSDSNKITLNIKSMLSKYYEKKLATNQQIDETKPIDFFRQIFNLNEDEVYYADGVTENSFIEINTISTKEYKLISDLLKQYCSCGVRFCFDKLERVKIFSDFIIDNIPVNKHLYRNITDSMLNDDNQLIYNSIETTAYETLPLYNFDDLDRKYVVFAKKWEGATTSDKLMVYNSQEERYVPNIIEFKSAELMKYVDFKDYVLAKMTVPPYLEFYGRVLDKRSDNTVSISFLLYDKDWKTLDFGKYKYLYSILNNTPTPMDLYYAKQSLPIIFKLPFSFSTTDVTSDDTRDSELMFPLLPRVNGEVKYEKKFQLKFGSPQDIKVGEYTGITQEVSKIYGLFEKNDLLYNRELDQFSNTIYPPIFALSNHVREDNNGLLNYTTFDNSDLQIEITKPTGNNSDTDAVLKLYNTSNVNKDIDLVVDEEIGRVSNRILQVTSLEGYNIGDVLIANPLENPSVTEKELYDNTLSKIRWRIIAKSTERNEATGGFNAFITLDSNYPKATGGKKYSFTKFPNWSIVYLQELYFRGNPVIQYKQEINVVSGEQTPDHETSEELYGEKVYTIETKLTNKLGLKKLIGYILDNFNGTKLESTKYIVPIKEYQGFDIELLDVITIKDDVFTQINENIKWLVTSVNITNGSNIVELKLINLNAKNNKPYDIDIENVLEYNPVELPEYSHTGGEGNQNKPNDGTGGTDTDDTLGQFWLQAIDTKDLSAKVDRLEGNYIYLKDFRGDKAEEYVDKLFPVSEFVLEIEGEVIFVQSVNKYMCFIKKRQVYDTERVTIAPEMPVKFRVLTTYVDPSGKFFSRSMYVGDAKSYLSYDIINGLKVTGNIVLGESMKNSDNELWNLLQNSNKIFRQPNEPQSTLTYKLKTGDVWYDTSDSNRVKIYSGLEWKETGDLTALGNARVFFLPTEPVSTQDYELKDGDLWYDTSDGNRPNVFVNGNWENARDKIYETEGGNKVHFSDGEPPIIEGSKDGDMWFDTNDNNKLRILQTINGISTWVVADDSQGQINRGEIVINGNTTFNGDAKIVSVGNNETTIIQGGRITFARNGKPITVIRNTRFGEIETDSKGKGQVSFPDFNNNMSILLSIKGFAISQNIRSIGCYYNLVNMAENRYQFFIYGTESTLSQGTAWTTSPTYMENIYSRANITAIGLSTSHFQSASRPMYSVGDISEWGAKYAISRGATAPEKPDTGTVMSKCFNDPTKYPYLLVKVYLITSTETRLMKEFTYTANLSCSKISWSSDGAQENPRFTTYAHMNIDFNGVVSTAFSNTEFNKMTQSIKIVCSIGGRTVQWTRLDGRTVITTEVDNSVLNCNVSMSGIYNEENIINLTGSGTLFYLAMED